MSRDFDVVIIGAGVIGCVMARLLVARKLCLPGRVALIGDRLQRAPVQDALSEDGQWDVRVFALGRASQRLLQTCGVWDALPKERLFAYERMCVWDASGEPQGAGSVSFDCAQIGEPNLGFIVEGRALQSQCLLAALEAGVVLIEAQVQALTSNRTEARVRSSDGGELRCRLLVAADGAESKTRESLGIQTAGHAYHQDALVAHVRTTKSHRNTAWQRFLSTGPLAFLPLPDGRSSIVWSAARAEAQRLMRLEPVAFGAALSAASGGVLGECELASPLARFSLKLQYALQYVRPRAVLLGDAAHAVHPLAGQGLNMGLLDCAALAEIFGEAPGADVFGEHRLLRRYERRRRSENMLTATALDAMERLFSSTNPVLGGLRAAGLSAVERLPFIKRRFAARALGLSGDVPAFLRADRP